MNKFQTKLIKEVIELIAPSAVGDVLIEITTGPNEVTVEVILKSKAVSLWIYQDEASVLGQNVDLRFETADYDDELTLARSFMQSARQVIASS